MPPALNSLYPLLQISMLPRIHGSKAAVFTRRLAVMNETLVPLGKQAHYQSTCALWHEAEAGRSGEEVASILVHLMEQHATTPRLTIWADNCTGQNKNWKLFAGLYLSVAC